MKKSKHQYSSIQSLADEIASKKENEWFINSIREAMIKFLEDKDETFVVKVDTTGFGYSEVRIMIDCESDDRKLWVEYESLGKRIRLSDDDLIIRLRK
jgi:TolB-like protein